MTDNPLTHMRKCFTKVHEAYYIFQKDNGSTSALEFCLNAQEDLQNAIVLLNRWVKNEPK
jgi:hypothetical protein